MDGNHPTPPSHTPPLSRGSLALPAGLGAEGAPGGVGVTVFDPSSAGEQHQPSSATAGKVFSLGMTSICLPAKRGRPRTSASGRPLSLGGGHGVTCLHKEDGDPDVL